MLCTVVVKLPIGSVRLYFVVGRRLKRETIGLWLYEKQCLFPPLLKDNSTADAGLNAPPNSMDAAEGGHTQWLIN